MLYTERKTHRIRLFQFEFVTTYGIYSLKLHKVFNMLKNVNKKQNCIMYVQM